MEKLGEKRRKKVIGRPWSIISPNKILNVALTSLWRPCSRRRGCRLCFPLQSSHLTRSYEQGPILINRSARFQALPLFLLVFVVFSIMIIDNADTDNLGQDVVVSGLI